MLLPSARRAGELSLDQTGVRDGWREGEGAVGGYASGFSTRLIKEAIRANVSAARSYPLCRLSSWQSHAGDGLQVDLED